MLFVLYLVGVISIAALALVFAAWRLPTNRGDLSLTAMCTAVLASLIATALTVPEHIIAVGASEDESVDLSSAHELIERSGLLVDEAQRREISRRKAAAL